MNANSSPPSLAAASARRVVSKDHPRDPLQGHVTPEMAEAVVDLLEVVQVSEHQHERGAVAKCALDLDLHSLLEPPPVEQPGQGVSHDRVITGPRSHDRAARPAAGSGSRPPARSPTQALEPPALRLRRTCSLFRPRGSPIFGSARDLDGCPRCQSGGGCRSSHNSWPT